MTVSRSREIAPTMELKTPAQNKDTIGVFGPGTPVKDMEGLNQQSASSPLALTPEEPSQGAVGVGLESRLRRSLRLASKLDSGLITGGVAVVESVKTVGKKRKSSDPDVHLETLDTGNVDVVEKGDLQMEGTGDDVPDNLNAEIGVSGGKNEVGVDVSIAKPVESGLRADSSNGSHGGDGSRMNGSRKRKFGVEAELAVSAPVVQDQGQKEKEIMYLRSGKKIVKSGANPSNADVFQGVENVGGDGIFSDNESRGFNDGCGENGGVMKEFKANSEVAGRDNTNRGNKLSVEDKGKGNLIEKDYVTSSTDMVERGSDAKEADGNPRDTRNTRRKDKGKEKVVDSGSTSNPRSEVSSLNDTGTRNESRASGGSSSHDVVVSSQNAGHINRMSARERFRAIARRNAVRFAHFTAQIEENLRNADVPRGEIPSSDTSGEAEDWPGPFSTAMKITRDRQKSSSQQRDDSVDKRGVAPITWTPRKDKKANVLKQQSVPLLQDMCVVVLAKHADAITSLNCVPDALRHKLSLLLSDSRRMDSHFVGLLLQGSPTEIRLRDGSWLSEEIFKTTFEGCDLSNLTVLQLDLCGRCLPDYILMETLACSPCSLPALTTISLRAAYRLSDIGLGALISAAPYLRSVDLGQCSLLTSDGICCLATSLGSFLKELYLDDCQSVEAMLILPALINLQNLEVLSLSGLETVSDDFIYEFAIIRGHNIKELGLADCTRLTDSAVKVIADTCPALCAIDLSNLCKLTDTAIGYLAGCRAIQNLRLRRNSFSDEAIAAYLETRGDDLRELSLSNVGQVAESTAISLSRHSTNLSYLDVSWCRNLTNEALGLIVDNSSSLRVLKVFGCSQITDVFLSGHSNQEVEIIGLKMNPLLEHLQEPDISNGLLRYSAV